VNILRQVFCYRLSASGHAEHPSSFRCDPVALWFAAGVRYSPDWAALAPTHRLGSLRTANAANAGSDNVRMQCMADHAACPRRKRIEARDKRL